MDLAAVLAWAAARAAHWLARVFRSIGCRCNAWIGRQFSGVVRGRRRALRRTGPRPPALCSGFRIKRGHCGSSWLRRSGGLRLLPFVLRGAAHRRETGRWTIHRTPLLRFWSPAALACHVACLCREAPPLRPSRFDRWPASSVLLRPWWSRLLAGGAPFGGSPTCLARDTVHPRTGLTLAVPAVFRLAEMARSTLRGSTPRVLAGTLRRSRRAPLHRTHAEPTTGHAPALSCSAGVPLPTVGVTWPGRAPFRRREACLGFRPVNLAGNEAGLSSRV